MKLLVKCRIFRNVLNLFDVVLEYSDGKEWVRIEDATESIREKAIILRENSIIRGDKLRDTGIVFFDTERMARIFFADKKAAISGIMGKDAGDTKNFITYLFLACEAVNAELLANYEDNIYWIRDKEQLDIPIDELMLL